MSAQASDTISVSSGTVGSVQVSKSPRQHLPSGPQALIKWAEEHSYGPVTSYTSTPVANHFSIGLREPGELKELPINLCYIKPQQREKKFDSLQMFEQQLKKFARNSLITVASVLFLSL